MFDTHLWAVCPDVMRSPSREDDPPRTFPSKDETLRFIGGVHDDRYWTKPIEIIRPSCLTDKQQIKTFREFLPPEQVGAIPEVTFDDFFDLATEEENADNLLSEPKYYLHSNWDFNTIVNDAKHRSGHVYNGRVHNGFAELIVRALYDIEEACIRRHRLAPDSLSAFLRSWQVQHHFHQFCITVANGPTGRMLLNPYGKSHARDCEQAIYIQLATHAHEIRESYLTVATSPQGVHQSLKDRLTDLRNESGLTFQDFAEQIGIDVRTTKRHCSGELTPRASLVMKYERLFSKLLQRQVVLPKTPPNATKRP